MGYTMQNGRWASTESVTLHPSAERTESGSGETIELGDRSTLRLLLDVTAASGTDAALDVAVETSHDGTTWRPALGYFEDTVSDVGTMRTGFSGCDRYVRAVWNIEGEDPSFTFSLTGEAV